MTECLETKFSRWSRIIKAVITRVLYQVESYMSHVQISHHRPEATPRPLTCDKPGPGGRRASPPHFYLALYNRGSRPSGPGARTWLSSEGPEAGRVLTATAFTPVAAEPVQRAKATGNAVAPSPGVWIWKHRPHWLGIVFL